MQRACLVHTKPSMPPTTTKNSGNRKAKKPSSHCVSASPLHLPCPGLWVMGATLLSHPSSDLLWKSVQPSPPISTWERRGPTCWPRQLASGPGQAVRPPSPEWCPAAPLCGGSGKVRGCSPLTGGGYKEGHSPTGPESPRLGDGAESACGLEAHGTHNCVSHVLPVRGRVWTRIS